MLIRGKSAEPPCSCCPKRAQALPAKRFTSIAAITSWDSEWHRHSCLCAFQWTREKSAQPRLGCAAKMPKLTIAIDGPAGSGKSSVARRVAERSEEHTSELQSQSNLVCRLLLEKK